MTGTDVNDDGFGYAISTERTGEDPYGDSFVFTFDANTGTLTDRDQISGIPDHQSLALGLPGARPRAERHPVHRVFRGQRDG